MAADPLVADRDIRSVDRRRVSKTECLLTMVDGRTVHRAESI